MQYKPWKALKLGDIIEIVAPAYPCAQDVITKAVAFIQSLGYVARVPEDLLGNDAFCSNSDEYRFNHLKQALFAEDSAAVWCIKGGYGSPRLIPYLEILTPPKKTKLLIGFSDITALHLFLQQRWGWSSLHAKVLFVFCRDIIDQPSIDELKVLISGEEKEVHYHGLTALNSAAKEARVVHGVVTGGNLSLLQTGIGTSWQVESRDKILFIEDIGERGYKVDRKLEQLRQAGRFDHALAVIFGDFSEGDEPDGQNFVDHAVSRFASSMTIPVVRIQGIGHEAVNHPLPLGTATQLQLGQEITLTSQSGAVS